LPKAYAVTILKYNITAYLHNFLKSLIFVHEILRPTKKGITNQAGNQN
jgi:hypothetical protein